MCFGNTMAILDPCIKVFMNFNAIIYNVVAALSWKSTLSLWCKKGQNVCVQHVRSVIALRLQLMPQHKLETYPKVLLHATQFSTIRKMPTTIISRCGLHAPKGLGSTRWSSLDRQQHEELTETSWLVRKTAACEHSCAKRGSGSPRHYLWELIWPQRRSLSLNSPHMCNCTSRIFTHKGNGNNP